MLEVFTKEIKELIPHRDPILLIEYVQVFPDKEIAISKCDKNILNEISCFDVEHISLIYFIEGIFQTAGVMFKLLYKDSKEFRKSKFLSRLDKVKIFETPCLYRELTFKVEVKSTNRFNDKFYGEILSENNPVLTCWVTSSVKVF